MVYTPPLLNNVSTSMSFCTWFDDVFANILGSMFHRERPEKEYRYGRVIEHRNVSSRFEFSPLYKKYELGTTVFSALASGLLTGKVWSKWSGRSRDISYISRSTTMVSPRVLGLRCTRTFSRGQSRVSKKRRVIRRSGKFKSSQHSPNRVSGLKYFHHISVHPPFT